MNHAVVHPETSLSPFLGSVSAAPETPSSVLGSLASAFFQGTQKPSRIPLINDKWLFTLQHDKNYMEFIYICIFQLGEHFKAELDIPQTKEGESETLCALCPGLTSGGPWLAGVAGLEEFNQGEDWKIGQNGTFELRMTS